MTLQYKPFKASARMVEAMGAGRNWFRYGEIGPGVALLQAGLVDLGYSLPRSTDKQGVLDGILGDETFEAIKQFQRSKQLKDDGFAGRLTISALDTALVKKTGPVPKTPVKPAPPPPVPPPTGPTGPPPVSPAAPPDDPFYRIGTADPHNPTDEGAGRWASKPMQASYLTLRAAILEILPPNVKSIATRAVTGPNAMRHMLHYFHYNGADLQIDLENMINSAWNTVEDFHNEILRGKNFCQKLTPGEHNITSKTVRFGNNMKDYSTDWFFATGGYQYWGKGKVRVSEIADVRHYDLEFEYKMFDRYNWDGGKAVDILGIEVTDEFMGEFHRQGLAREFNQHGSARRRLRWRHDDNIPPADISTPVGGR
jgi:peptidoglycan hydrolase-like protein with peptidoglycan-binding domain